VKFTLKDYQVDAVEDVLVNLKRARYAFKSTGERSSFSLAATTGAGKTVMAAAAIEALFWGNDTFDFEPDPGAVVLWFSDDPSLNLQTHARLRQASEKFTYSNLELIEPPFSAPRLAPGKVYFLNTQKLGTKSLLTRGHVESGEGQENLRGLNLAAPDMQGWTLWQTLANTIEAPDLTLYLVLDEAHRGFSAKTTAEKPTIVRKLVNGTTARPAIPIVWGISATPKHFQDAMQKAEATGGRRALPDVRVDPIRVQESGLVKDTLILDIPDEAGNFDSVLVRRAARKLKDSTERWAKYARVAGPQGECPAAPHPADPEHAQPRRYRRRARHHRFRVPGAEVASSVRHVLGDHSAQEFGAWKVDWIEPQRVQDERVTCACSLRRTPSRPAGTARAPRCSSHSGARTDNTHITQLLGRMVRNPLARRIPGDERLNAVDCILPFFDRTTAVKVVRFLTGELDEMPGGEKKVVLDGRELLPNPNVPNAVRQLWSTLPTQTIPQRGARPVKRLVMLAQALSADDVAPGALAAVKKELHRVLDAYALLYQGNLDAAVKEVWDVHVKQIEGRFGKKGLTYAEFVERADDRAIRTGLLFAKKAFGADIVDSYVNYVAGPDNVEADDDGLREAYVRAAALATVKDVRDEVDLKALAITERLFGQHRVKLKSLTDERQQEYENVRAMATDPQRGELRPPRTRIEDFADRSGDDVVAAPVVPLHLMSDEAGNFPLTSLNSWEREAVLAELKRSDVRGWYRNPSRAAVDSLGVAYRDETTGNWRSMHPDLIFFNEIEGRIVASILDPHGHHLADAPMKLKALAAFAKKYGDAFHRIEAMSKVDNVMRVLDMKREAVREAVLHGGEKAEDLYRSELGVDYQPGE
jgi:type III restriction enzyme